MSTTFIQDYGSSNHTRLHSHMKTAPRILMAMCIDQAACTMFDLIAADIVHYSDRANSRIRQCRLRNFCRCNRRCNCTVIESTV